MGYAGQNDTGREAAGVRRRKGRGRMFSTDDLVAQAQAFAEEQWDRVQADLADLVAIDSAKGKPDAAAGAPYGPGPRRALDAMLAKARALGLEAHECDGHIGYADLPGCGPDVGGAGAQGRRQLGIIGHLDTVPAGAGWSSDPLTLTERDGLLVGRGVSDDKGPLICAVHAVRFWTERNARTGQAFPHDIRLLFGCDEESGMGDADWYLAHFAAPDFLFTPDAEFPVCYGEKGQFQALIESQPIGGGAIRDLSAGQAVNAVPGSARATVVAAPGQLTQATGITVAPAAGPDAAGLFTVEAAGVAGHAAMPEGSVNALGVLASYLLAQGVGTAAEQEWLRLVRAATAATDGSLFGIACADADFGPLTCVAGKARTVPAGPTASAPRFARFTLSIDCRFPTAIDCATLQQKVAAYLQQAVPGATLTPLSQVEPLLVDPDTAPVRALRQAYRAASGRDAAPVTMGGGTYAHHFPVGTSFGAEDLTRFPRPSWAGGMHAVDEAVPVAELKQALVAYIVAIGLLMDGDLA